LTEKVSIVIPVYNCEKYISQSIESALNQDYPDFEVIVIDDGSTDDTGHILESFSDEIKIIKKKNGHTGSALNAGIKQMKGEWFKELQADDRLLQNCLADMLEFVHESKKEDTIFYADVNWIDENQRIKFHWKELNYNSLSNFDFNILLLQHNIGNGTSVLIHNSAFKKHGYFDEITKHEDYEMRLRWCILEQCRMHYIERLVGEYRIHDLQYTKQRRITDILMEDIQIKQKIIDQLNEPAKLKYAKALLSKFYDRRQYPELFQNPKMEDIIRMQFNSLKPQFPTIGRLG